MCANVSDYRQLDNLVMLASKASDRVIMVIEESEFKEQQSSHKFWAVREKCNHESWLTGRRIKNPKTGKVENEVSASIFEAQLFVREMYAVERLSMLNRSGVHDVLLQEVYVNVENVFLSPCVVTICVNKQRNTTRYLKSYKEDDHHLRYTENLSDAMLLYPEESQKVYDYLSSRYKNLSFTMIVKPDKDIAAKDLRGREKDLVQRMACDFYLGRNKPYQR